MNHPMDKRIGDLIKAAAEGPEAMNDWLTDLQKSVGAPDGPELPDSIELEYADGTKETIDTTKPLAGQGRFPQFYNHNNPMPQTLIDLPPNDDWMDDEDEA